MESPLTETSQAEVYAFFDVDGTVIEQDSFRIIIKELIFKRSITRSFVAICLCGVLFVPWLLKLVGKTQFKSALLWSATVGLGRIESIRQLRRVIQTKVDPLWFSEMGPELEMLRTSGHNICYVSASGEPWLRPLLQARDPERKLIIGSKLTFFCGGLTLKGPNCIGVEKIKRLKKIIPDQSVWAVAYSDHRADIPLFLACSRRVVVNPTQKSRQAIEKALGAQQYTLVNWTVAQNTAAREALPPT